MYPAQEKLGDCERSLPKLMICDGEVLFTCVCKSLMLCLVSMAGT